MSHAIIGCGRVAPNHVFGIKSAGVEIIACCDIDEESLNSFASEHNIRNKFKDYKELLSIEDLESVSVCTDHASHAEITIAALNAGKHVFVEKPMALSVSDGEKMIDASTKNTKVLSVVSQHRYDPLVKEIVKLFKEGLFGKINMINGTLNSYKDEKYYSESSWRGKLSKEGGSTLINQAIHTLDLMVLLMDKPVEISAKKAILKFGKIIETEDTIATLMKFKNGALGTLSSTNTSVKFWDSKIEIVGSKGNISFKTGFPFYVFDLELEDKEEQIRIKGIFDEITNRKEELPPTQDYYGVSHKYQIKNFIDATRGKSKLEMHPNEALKTLEVVLGIYEKC